MGSNPGDTFNQMRPPVTMPGYHTGREPANKGKTRHLRCRPPPRRRARAHSPRKQGEKPRSLPRLKCSPLLDQISTTSSLGLRNRALIAALYRAGLRHAEELALFPKDVDLAAGSIAVLHGKGDRRRTVGIDPGACDVIRVWIERRDQLGFGSAVPPPSRPSAGLPPQAGGEVSGPPDESVLPD